MRPRNVFVSVPDGFQALYENAILPLNAGRLRTVSFFDHRSSGPFSLSIRRQIAHSNLLIGVMSGNNPNVMYEIGIAVGNNKPVILVTDSIKDIPSMLAHLNVRHYDASMPDWKKLYDQLREDCESAFFGHYSSLRRRTHNEILIRQRNERESTQQHPMESSRADQDPIEHAITLYEKGKYRDVIGRPGTGNRQRHRSR